MLFKPLLASDAVLENLRFPLLASPKLDGVRAIVRDGVVYSRSNKPIPNKAVQEKFREYEHFDGELIVGSPTSHSVYRDTVSTVMSHDKPADDVHFYVFDHIEELGMPYTARRHVLAHVLKTKSADIFLHQQQSIDDLGMLLAYEQQCLNEGYEGLILRDPNSQYKMGRSTAKEGILLKLKRFLDAEAEVIGFEERMHNGNEATTDELGRTKRSSHQANKTGRGDLGALLVRFNGIDFAIGTGFDDADRRHIWERQADFIGKLAKFKYFPVGVKDAPRHPVFLGWRDGRDL